ncbi:hypothetical protein CDAR_111171 [Caerostris darwini]|uniref:Uncharacterized protein n=1 Tax=Caerostris darwini TaxID=1538125 RepID=A0AAV4STY0_9ARAC|nr:hypothetical protein CDAR_111171 [Caerostris darwini]
MFQKERKTNPGNTFRLGVLGFCFGKVLLLRITEEFFKHNEPTSVLPSGHDVIPRWRKKIKKSSKSNAFPNVYKLSVLTIANESVCPE